MTPQLLSPALDAEFTQRAVPPETTSFPNSRPAIATVYKTNERFPGYSNVREIVNGMFAATANETGVQLIVRLLPDRHFDDPRQQIRYASNLDRAALLSGPGIVAIIDRGVTSDRLPFIARKHVNGVPIDVFGRGEAFAAGTPPVRTILAVFEKACRAVQIAHDAGVLHGSLKSGNILIDANAEPQIVDFGVNLSLNAETSNDVTAMGHVLLDLLRQQSANADPLLIELAMRAAGYGSVRTFGSIREMADAVAQYLRGQYRSVASTDEQANTDDRQTVTRPVTISIVGSACGFIVAAAIHWGSTSRALLAIGILAAAAVGGLAVVAGRPKTKTGVLLAGLGSGMSAGVIVWLFGGGALIVEWILQPTLSRAALVGQAKVLSAFPDLNAIPESQRLDIALQRVSSSFADRTASASIVGVLTPLLVGIGFGCLGAFAIWKARESRQSLVNRIVGAIELSLPGQLAITMLAVVTVCAAAGVASPIPWQLVVSAMVLAAMIAWAVASEMPMVARFACYLSAIVAFSHIVGRGVGDWVGYLVYVMTIFFLWRFVSSAHPACQRSR